MGILNIFKRKQKKNNSVSKETNVTFPILPCIEPNTFEKPKVDREEEFLVSYINRIKSDEKIKELFPEIMNKLEEDLSREEKEKLLEPIQMYEIKEKRRRDVFYHLPYEYNKAIKGKVEENYKTGKIEELPLCKTIALREYEELVKLYPEEMKYLEDLYLPIYEEYMDEYLYKSESNFNDLTEFAKFIEKINFYKGSMISDEYFNVVNDSLEYYGTEFYGDNLSGFVKYYSLQYDNYLKVKSNITSEIEILMNENMNEEAKREAVIKIKNKSGFYLSTRTGSYMV